MPPVNLNDLPRWWPQTLRLLGGERVPTAPMDFTSVQGTYEQTYGACLQYLDERGGEATMEDLRRHQRRQGHSRGGDVRCVSVGDDLMTLDLDEVDRVMFDSIIEAVGGAAESCRTVVDLGAGFGYLIHRLRQVIGNVRWIGADASAHACRIARRLLGDRDDVSFHRFNYYEPDTYSFLEHAETPVLIVTRHSLEQLPEAGPFFEALGRYRHRVAGAIHFEPVYRPDDETLLGVLRRRYLEAQNYNRDLLDEIARRPDLRLVRDEPSVFGSNPLNPTSIVQWEYVQ